MLTCLAIDDEPLSLHVVSTHIERTPFLRLLGAFTSSVAALDFLRQTPVDVLFLDIRMPELNGLELARALTPVAGGGAPRTRVVFTTAFPQFALDGFRLDALDYLLKPIEYPDFLRVALKAHAYFEAVRPAPAPEPVAAPDAIVLRVDYYLVRVPFDDILYVEGLKDYVKVHRRGDAPPLLTLSSVRALEERLPADRFVRLHRSFIVNRRHIEALGRHAVRLGGATVPVGGQYRDALAQLVTAWEQEGAAPGSRENTPR